VTLASGAWRLAPVVGGSGEPIDSTWSSVDPGGGFAEIGPFGLPWVPALVVIAVWGAIETFRRLLSGRPLWTRPKLQRSPKPTRRQQVQSGLMFVVLYGSFLVIGALLPDDPILYGSINDPGQDVTDVRPGGLWPDERSERFGFSSVDRYVYEVDPGETFAYVLSVRNDWPFPITVLGLSGPPESATEPDVEGFGFVSTGLGLLRDPMVISTDPADVVPFRPTQLAPGQEMAIVVAEVAGPCADPAGDLPVDPPNTQTSGKGIGLVFEVFGWRQVGFTWPPFEVSVPVKPDCLPNPFENDF
jgi:hypothetical protein